MKNVAAIICGIIFILIGIFVSNINKKALNNCTIEAEATVVEIEEVRERSKNEDEMYDYIYYPILEYKAGDKLLKVKHKTGSNPSKYEVGDKVTILYNENKVDEFIIKGDKNLKYGPIIFIAIGIILIASGIILKIKE